MANAATLSILIQAKDQASGALNAVGKSSDGLSGKLKALIGAAAGLAAAYVGMKTITGAIDATEELGSSVRKLSRETGLSSEDASRWMFAFHHVGLTGDDASRSLGILAKKLKGVQDEETGVTEGGKSTADILADIGIKATDADGNLRPFSDLLPQISDQFKAMPDGIEKTGLAMQLFGRSGKDMIPLLNQGSEGLEELGKMADKLGVTLSADNVEKIKEYTLAHRDMEEAIAGVKLQIGLALMPVLTKLTNWFIEQQPKIREFVSEAIDKLKDALANMQPIIQQVVEDMGHLAEATQAFGGWLIDHKEALIAALVGIGVAFAWANPAAGIAIAVVGIAGAIELLRADVDKMPRSLLELRLGILEVLEPTLKLIETMTDFGGLLKWLPGDIGNLARAATGLSIEAEKLADEGLSDVQQNLKDTQARLDEMDAADAMTQFQQLGKWTDETTKSSGSLISMTDMMNPALDNVDSSGVTGQLDNICTAADSARAALDRLVVSAAQEALSRIRNFLGQFGPQQSTVPAYQMGGVVSGPLGAPQLAMVHGGERIIPVGGSTTVNRGGPTFYGPVTIHVEGSGDIWEQVERQLR